MKLLVSAGKGKSSATVEFPKKEASDITVAELESKVLKEVFKKSKDRLRIQTTAKVTLSESKKTLESYNLKDGDQLILKDLGPQISWKNVFIAEYLGPILIHPFFYYFSEAIYGYNFEHSPVQKAVLYMVVAHFLKREYETLFVHRFSHATMPLSNLFKNCTHYHILSGFLIAYFVYSPKYATPQEITSPLFYYGCFALYLFGEISNFMTHITLRDLRPLGSTTRLIPYGYGFNMVSCPNYFFETIAWVAISLLSGHWSSWLFTVVAFGQMYVWALKKHRQYKKEFPEYPKGRKAIIPFIA